jgi:hypothetical protein
MFKSMGRIAYAVVLLVLFFVAWLFVGFVTVEFGSTYRDEATGVLGISLLLLWVALVFRSGKKS